MNDPDGGDKEKPEGPEAETPADAEGGAAKPESGAKASADLGAKAEGHRLRNAVVAAIGTPAFLGILAVGAFALFAQFDPRDPNPPQADRPAVPAASGLQGLTPDYYRVAIDYVPRQQRFAADGFARRMHDLGAILFDTGLTTKVEATARDAQAELWRTGAIDAAASHRAAIPFARFGRAADIAVAIKVTQSAAPRLRWAIDLPDWASGGLETLVPSAPNAPPGPFRLAPPDENGRPYSRTAFAIRDRKGVAIGDLHVSVAWRPTVLFDPALIRPTGAVNAEIVAFVERNADAAARRFAVARMIRSTDPGFDAERMRELKIWIVARFADVRADESFYADNAAAPSRNVVDRFAQNCVDSFETVRDRFAVSETEAALLTYFLHRDEPSFTTRDALDSVCGSRELGAVLVRIGAPPSGEMPTIALANRAEGGRSEETDPRRVPAGPASRVEILSLLADEWRRGLAVDARQISARYIHPEATLTVPNEFGQFTVTPQADMTSILDDHAANRVRHFACFTDLNRFSMGAIVERSIGQSGRTGVYRYRFYFEKPGGASNSGLRIKQIRRRDATQQDIAALLDRLRDRDCVRRYLKPELARILRVLKGDPAATPPNAAASVRPENAQPPTVIVSNAPRRPLDRWARSNPHVIVDLSVLETIR